MQPSKPLWRTVAEKAASEIMKTDFKTKNEERIKRLQTSCAVTAEFLWETY